MGRVVVVVKKKYLNMIAEDLANIRSSYQVGIFMVRSVTGSLTYRFQYTVRKKKLNSLYVNSKKKLADSS